MAKWCKTPWATEAPSGAQVEYAFDGPRLLGTGGALRAAADRLGPAFLVMYGDSYLRCDFPTVEQAFLDGRFPALMTIFRNDGRFDRSNVLFDAGRILCYDKRRPTPEMRHIDYGLGALRERSSSPTRPMRPSIWPTCTAGLPPRAAWPLWR